MGTIKETRTDHEDPTGMRNPPLPYYRRVRRKGDRKIKKWRKTTITTRAREGKKGKEAKITEGKRTRDHRMDEKETACMVEQEDYQLTTSTYFYHYDSNAPQMTHPRK
jgi:hypothetical protein